MAKQAQSTLINMFLSLTVIAVVAGAALAMVNSVTAEPIAKVQKAKTEKAIQAVLPAYKDLAEVDVDGVTCSKALDADGKLVGVAVPTSSEKGFGGHLGLIVGFTADGEISGYQILETSETPGLGAKAGFWFQKGGKGNVIGKNPGKDNGMKVKKDGGTVDAISGSTITSRAFCDAVNTAYAKYEKIQKGDNK
jgi:electron transport complex protein RnfG